MCLECTKSGYYTTSECKHVYIEDTCATQTWLSSGIYEEEFALVGGWECFTAEQSSSYTTLTRLTRFGSQAVCVRYTEDRRRLVNKRNIIVCTKTHNTHTAAWRYNGQTNIDQLALEAMCGFECLTSSEYIYWHCWNLVSPLSVVIMKKKRSFSTSWNMYLSCPWYSDWWINARLGYSLIIYCLDASQMVTAILFTKVCRSFLLSLCKSIQFHVQQ